MFNSDKIPAPKFKWEESIFNEEGLEIGIVMRRSNSEINEVVVLGNNGTTTEKAESIWKALRIFGKRVKKVKPDDEY